MRDESRPHITLALLVVAVVTGLFVGLRFLVFPEDLIPLTYILGLLLTLWHRRRWLHYSLASVYMVMSSVKVTMLLPVAGARAGELQAFWAMQLVNILVGAVIVDAVNRLRERLEHEREALAQANSELEATNEELAAREEEIRTQNEELQQQTEELEQQTEELQEQAGELANVNTELQQREKTIQGLLDLSKDDVGEDDSTKRICELALRILPAVSGVSLIEACPEGLRVRSCIGFEPRSLLIPTERAVAALVLEKGETGFLADTRLRPDLEVVSCQDGTRFRSVLTTPFRVQGQAVGAFEFYSSEPRTWSATEIRLVEWLSAQCAKLWEIVRLRAERERAGLELQAVNEELQAVNEELENRVAERTALAEERAARLRDLASELSRAEQRERRRLAKVLHDHLQQYLVAAKLQAGALSRQSSETAVLGITSEIDQLLTRAIETSRTLTAELSPVVLDRSGLLAAIQWLSGIFTEKHGLKVEVSATTPVAVSDSDLAAFLFDAIREMLFNVIKHAATDSAWVSLRQETSGLVVEVTDHGRGFLIGDDGLSNLGGFGLFSIQQRLESMSGELRVTTTLGKGTTISAFVPLPVRDAGEAARIEGASLPDRQLEFPFPMDGNRKVRLLLVDDHAIFRQGIANLLAQMPDIQIVGQAASGEDAIAQAIRLQPHIVLMDVNMPGMDGIEATRRLVSECPDIRVIGLSMYTEADCADSILRAGARAYVTKDSPAESLLAVIRRHSPGQTPCEAEARTD